MKCCALHNASGFMINLLKMQYLDLLVPNQAMNQELKREPLSYTSPLGVDTSGFMINLADIRVFHSIIQWLLRIQENSLHLCTISINHGKRVLFQVK